jgi:hypothetical protein
MGRARSMQGEKRNAYRILVALPFIRKRKKQTKKERKKERKGERDDLTNRRALP